VRSVMRDMSPREVWEGVPVPPNPARLAVWTEAQAEGIVWRQLVAPLSLYPWSVLWRAGDSSEHVLALVRAARALSDHRPGRPGT